jgi:hypothetical protein
MPLVPVYQSHFLDMVQGWVGLLNCSGSGGSEFVGIVLETIPKQPKSAQVKRVLFESNGLKSALHIGPRVACQVVRHKVTIIQDNKGLIDWNYYYGRHHFIINESQALLDMGCSVSYASGLNVDRPFGYGI